jgi:uncharacterized RDD family membrane protein YckC
MPEAPPTPNLPRPPVVDMAKATKAPIVKRLAASAIDLLLSICLIMPLLSYAGILEKLQLQQRDFTLVQFFFGFMSWQGIYLLLNARLLAQHGQTIGKRLMRLRIVEATGHACTLTHLFFVRRMIPQVAWNLPFIGLGLAIGNLAFIFRPDRRCLHDHLASTVVIEA